MQGATAKASKSQDIRRAAYVAAGLAFCLSLAACSAKSKVDPKIALVPAAVETGESDPKGGGEEKSAKPVKVAGSSSAILSFENYSAEGLSSWYGSAFHGRRTANGEIFDMDSLTAAHPSMPLPSYARVTNLNNGKSVVVRVNDRGPFHGDRALDVSRKTAEVLGFKNHGMARVRIDYVGPASLKGSDDAKLMTTYRENGHEPPPVLTASLDRDAGTEGPHVIGNELRRPVLASLAPRPAEPLAVAPAVPHTAPAPVAASAPSAETKPNDPQPALTAATTPVDVASRIQSSFGNMTTPAPVTGNQRPQMVQPILSGFAFEPSTFATPR